MNIAKFSFKRRLIGFNRLGVSGSSWAIETPATFINPPSLEGDPIDLKLC